MIPFGPPSQFAFNNILTLERQGVDVNGDDILQNFTTKELQKMNDTVPWSGPRERNLLLLQMLIEAAPQLGDLVLDCTSTIGYLLPLGVCTLRCTKNVVTLHSFRYLCYFGLQFHEYGVSKKTLKCILKFLYGLTTT
jgi:hypothetical protein